MAGRLKREIKQTKPFAGLEDEAMLNLLRTADLLLRRLAETLKPARLSPPQYNILRILRGAGEHGLACREVGERMITKDPDITRLLDRLEKRGLVTRSRDRKDRRVVLTRITEDGVRLLRTLEGPIQRVPVTHFEHLGAQRLRRLIDLLETARTNPE